MAFVTHLDKVRADIRTAWPSGTTCPPLVVRWRAGSERAGWGTLVQLAQVRGERQGDPIVENLTRAVAVELVARSDGPETAEMAKHLIAGTLGLVGGTGRSELTAVDAYLSGAA